MYGSTNRYSSSNDNPPVPAAIPYHFSVIETGSTPTGSASLGTIAVKAQIPITRFTICNINQLFGSPSSQIHSEPLFRDMPEGTVFYLVKLGGSSVLTIPTPPFRFGITTGTHMYQKVLTSSTLIPVDAWVYDGGSWKSMNY